MKQTQTTHTCIHTHTCIPVLDYWLDISMCGDITCSDFHFHCCAAQSKTPPILRPFGYHSWRDSLHRRITLFYHGFLYQLTYDPKLLSIKLSWLWFRSLCFRNRGRRTRPCPRMKRCLAWRGHIHGDWATTRRRTAPR